MAVRIQFRRGTYEEWFEANPVLSAGELGYESTNKIIKFGVGGVAWNDLPVAAAGDVNAVLAGAGLKYGNLSLPRDNSVVGESGVIELEVDPTQVVMTSTFDSAGDTLVGTGEDTYTVLHVGSNGQTIIADSSQSTGVRWGTPTDPIISNNYINTDMLAASSVTEAKIRGSATVDADRSITTEKIRDSAITEAKLANNAVTEGKILNSSVSTDKLRGDSNDANDSLRAVTSDKIRNLAITTSKIANTAVTPGKLNNTVYYRATDLGTNSTARIFIQAISSPPVTGNPGDIWFAYEP